MIPFPLKVLTPCAIAGALAVAGTGAWSDAAAPPPTTIPAVSLPVDEPPATILVPGPQGPAPTPDQLAEAVVAYCAARDECRGEPGVAGRDGVAGLPGATGATGAAGVDGAVGPAGASVVGPAGRDGIDGIDGLDGQTVVGPAGPPGADGPPGLPGADSQVPGPPGPVATELPCPAGFTAGPLTLNAPGGQVTMFVCLES